MMNYHDFLKTKEIKSDSVGFEPTSNNPTLFDWQSDIVRWALMKGRAAIFADCGLGKTAMQLQWSAQVSEHTGKPVLICAPLAVAAQTQREGIKFNVPVTVCRKQCDVQPGVNITNYEMLSHFEAERFSGVVLDESSILKDATSSTRKLLTAMFKNTPFKLCCTATPSPNDYMELGTHSEFLGIMTQPEMLSTFFCHDGGKEPLFVAVEVLAHFLYHDDIAEEFCSEIAVTLHGFFYHVEVSVDDLDEFVFGFHLLHGHLVHSFVDAL